MEASEKLKLGLALALGVSVPGLFDYLLSTNGYHTLGMAVWAVGYVTAVLVIWYVWLRPLDLRGSAG